MGTSRDTGFDIKALTRINETLEKDVIPKYKHLLDDSKVSLIDIDVTLHQTPDFMCANLEKQLREMDALDKIDEVYKELPRARKKLKASAPSPTTKPAAAEGSAIPVLPPMPGVIVKSEKNVGDTVNAGDAVVVIEAMKMENILPATADGTITAINFTSGHSVAKDDMLATIE